MKINFAEWKIGFRTGMDSPIMRQMTVDELNELAEAHYQQNTSHDYGMASAAQVLAMKKEQVAATA